jgi:glycosyltransferase involved in cell wall biosynthesis
MEFNELTVIIPAKDENIELRNLLNCLKEQTFQKFTIVIADNSTTRIVKDICNDHDIKIVKGGLPGQGRNKGASTSFTKYLLFLDADISIKKDFIQNALSALKKKNVDCLSFGFFADTTNKYLILLHWVAKCYFYLSTKIGFIHGIGGAILVKREIHELVDGFDEEIKVAEDHNYLKRIAEKHSYEFLLTPSVTVNVRRFTREGILYLCLKYFRIDMHRLFISEIRDDRIPYFEKKPILSYGKGSKLRFGRVQNAEVGN